MNVHPYAKKAIRPVMLTTILLFTLFLSYYNFGNEGYGNSYYAAAIKSMMSSWHNFFFVSFDPGGFVNVDKPPVALWIQAAFAMLFGFHSWSLLLPEALAAVASVAVIYHLICSRFGFGAGIAAAIILSCTPIFIAASRSNNPDAILALILILSAWAMIAAAEKGSLKHLILAAVLVGIGFNTKMLVAFLVIPAFIAAYFFSNAIKTSKKFIHLAIAAVVLVAVSFSWVTVVDLTPASQRPFVGSSSTNSEMNLVFGYNGLNRVLPSKQTNTNDKKITKKGSHQQAHDMAKSNAQTDPQKVNNQAGFFRMFNDINGDQISWFVPLALLGMGSAFVYVKSLEQKERRKKYVSVAVWGGWAIVMLVFFSTYRSLTHRYYLNIIAPGLAAIAGIGLSCMWKLYKGETSKAFFLPVTFILSAVLQIFLVSKYPAWSNLILPILCICIAIAAALIVIKIPRIRSGKHLSMLFATCCFAMLLFAPALWSFTTVIYHVSGGDAYAGPELNGKTSSASTPLNVTTMLQKLQFNGGDPKISAYYAQLSEYLKKYQGNSKYIVAVPNTAMAENIIFETGQPVMAIGGFSGSNPILTLDKFKKMVASGTVKYMLNAPSAKGGSNVKIENWIVSNSKKIDTLNYEKKPKYDIKNYSLYLLPTTMGNLRHHTSATYRCGCR